VFYPDDATRADVRGMFEEQVGWIVDAGMDYVVAETFSWGEEALLALEVIKEAGLTAVVTLSIHRQGEVREGWSPEDTCRRLEQAGADVVGLNCIRGPRTMLPLVARIRDAVDCHVAALPVPYRTTEAEPSFQSLTDPGCDCLPDDRPFPTALDPLLCNRYEIAQFGREAYDLGIRYLGVCCGAAPHMIRSLAEALGRETPASRYSPDMSRHPFLGTHDQLREHNQQYAKEL
jgi:betaine-homocysteine S-methyltransferase